MFDERLTKAMRCKRIHFIGIGGSGMSGIAELLLHYGYAVSGSDLNPSSYTQRLAAAGATVFYTHDPQNIAGVEVVVYSSAITEDNPELMEARRLHLSVIPRAQMLVEIMRFNVGIAIVGTHGKTTTTSLLAHMLVEGGLDPAYVVGGILNSSHRSARAGAGAFFVIEADESDGSFLRFNPVISVITNIDRDHISNYHMQLSELKDAFVKFAHQLPFYGLAVVCYDDPNVRAVLKYLDRQQITYGFEDGAEVRLSDFVQDGFSSSFKVSWSKYQLDHFELHTSLTGRHNALNAVAALIVATAGCGLPVKMVANSLSSFSGVGRRMERHGYLVLPQGGKTLLIEDYGHHPREIQATIVAVRAACPGSRLVMLFQPHRYSRTYDLWQDFVQVLGAVDLLILMNIYAASEMPISQVTSERLASEIESCTCNKVHCCYDTESAVATVLPLLQDGDLLLVQGAGDVNKAVKLLLDGCRVLNEG